MSVELRQIDLSCLDACTKLDEATKALRALIEKAEVLRHKVPEAVFARVIGDYTHRLHLLDAQAAPLRDQARSAFTQVGALHDRLQAALDHARLALQEVDFRREVGELGDEEFAKRQKAAQEMVNDCERAVDEVNKVSQRFNETLPSDTTTLPAGPKPASKKGTAAEVTIIQEGATVKAVSKDVSTMTVPQAQLVPAHDLDGRAHRLGGVTLIGRTVDNQIPIDSPDVSRRHARIAVTDGVFTLTDLNSGNGTFVNGKRVSECALSDGDQLQFGKSTFVFRSE